MNHDEYRNKIARFTDQELEEETAVKLRLAYDEYWRNCPSRPQTQLQGLCYDEIMSRPGGDALWERSRRRARAQRAAEKSGTGGPS
jgi:hypothetical protein